MNAEFPHWINHEGGNMQTGNPYAFGLKAAALCALVCLSAAPAASAQSMAGDGFWKGKENPDSDYASFLKIEGDRGFYCVLDGKSSFAFRICHAHDER
jgi:hypothetical protein